MGLKEKLINAKTTDWLTRDVPDLKLKQIRDLALISAAIETRKVVTAKPPEIIHCEDCRYWSDYICFCEKHDIRCQDYYIGDMHTESDFYCGYAKRKQNEVKE